ncbi:hypothetical protein GCM10010412_065090 [Nonomuraea recticatena]|uniref:Uncharacterized protein n=1 Tax=Nonomuraea recticatena TaxID=46178 RepID=A0ABN3SNP9_9ACTN
MCVTIVCVAQYDNMRGGPPYQRAGQAVRGGVTDLRPRARASSVSSAHAPGPSAAISRNDQE